MLGLSGRRSVRCVCYVPHGNHTVDKLRGLPALRRSASMRRLNPLAGRHGRLTVSAFAPDLNHSCHDEVLFIGQVADYLVTDYLQRRYDSGRKTIIDIYANVIGDPLRHVDDDRRESLMPFTSLDENVTDTDAAEWWAVPGRQKALRHALCAANVVTTPHPELITPLRIASNMAHVYYLPDATGPSDWKFVKRFQQILTML